MVSSAGRISADFRPGIISGFHGSPFPVGGVKLSATSHPLFTVRSIASRFVYLPPPFIRLRLSVCLFILSAGLFAFIAR